MKVITIGTDRKLFDESSTVLSRLLKYSTKVEEMYVIVFTKRGLGLKEKAIEYGKEGWN